MSRVSMRAILEVVQRFDTTAYDCIVWNFKVYEIVIEISMYLEDGCCGVRGPSLLLTCAPGACGSYGREHFPVSLCCKFCGFLLVFNLQ